jgi:hypothetical protein
MRINNGLQAVLALSSTVCHTHHINIGQIGTCARGGNWPLTGTIPYPMSKEASTFLGAACDLKPNGADGINGGMSTVLP